MLGQGNNLRLRGEGGSRGRSSTQDQKTRTVSTCWINPGGLSLMQASPQHADPHGLGAFLKKNHTSVVGWSAGRHVDRITHVGGKFRHGLLEKPLTKYWIVAVFQKRGAPIKSSLSRASRGFQCENSGSRFDPRPQRMKISHLIPGGRRNA